MEFREEIGSNPLSRLSHFVYFILRVCPIPIVVLAPVPLN